MNLESLLAAVRDHAWPIVAAVVIGGLVRLIKSDAIPIPMPPRWRPVLALGLGLASGACDAIIRGTSWQEALGMGLLSSFVAMGGHDVLIEALRGGAEVSAPKAGGGAAVFIVAVLSAALSGCAGGLQDAADALNAANTIATEAQPCLVSQKTALLAQCEAEPCKRAVTERFEAIAEAYDAFNSAWCVVAPESEGCK